jgi:hypothetical protein
MYLVFDMTGISKLNYIIGYFKEIFCNVVGWDFATLYCRSNRIILFVYLYEASHTWSISLRLMYFHLEFWLTILLLSFMTLQIFLCCLSLVSNDNILIHFS